jgi:SAM-dependent methyltransferase
MYELLSDFLKRPAPFCRYTAKELWTRPHLAQQMLDFHLSQDTDLASRRFEAIDLTVDWLDAQIDFSSKRVCDLGCGPGLYTERFASRGADVTGVDFSRHSLRYAERQGSQSVSYIEADYLVDDLPTGFDLVTLIFNWTQHFSPLSIEEELRNAGFQVEHRAGDLSGTPLVAASDLIGIIARMN